MSPFHRTAIHREAAADLNKSKMDIVFKIDQISNPWITLFNCVAVEVTGVNKDRKETQSIKNKWLIVLSVLHTNITEQSSQHGVSTTLILARGVKSKP